MMNLKKLQKNILLKKLNDENIFIYLGLLAFLIQNVTNDMIYSPDVFLLFNIYNRNLLKFMESYTIHELIDVVQGELTVSGMLPKILPDIEIRRLVENKAQPWFYQNYQYAVQKLYFFINKINFVFLYIERKTAIFQ